MDKKRTNIYLDAADKAAIKKIRDSYGITSESDVVRFALRLVAREEGKPHVIKQAQNHERTVLAMENLDNPNNPTTPGREEILQFIIANFMALCNVAEIWVPELEKHEGWRKLKQHQFDLAQAVGLPAVKKKGEELRQAVETMIEENL